VGPSSLLKAENTVEMSIIGIYDPERSGGLLEEINVRGGVNGIVALDNGLLVAGLETSGWDTSDETPLLAIIGDNLEDWERDGYDVVSMCVDESTNRIYCILYTGGHVIGDILVWDYDTYEFDIIQTGLDMLSLPAFLEGKLYCGGRNDNKIYIVDVD
jgi:outer membrane protein assembly factor BamB